MNEPTNPYQAGYQGSDHYRGADTGRPPGIYGNVARAGAPLQPVRPFVFDGGAGTYLGVSIAAFLITVLSFGILVPWAIVLRYRWRSNTRSLTATAFGSPVRHSACSEPG